MIKPVERCKTCNGTGWLGEVKNFGNICKKCFGKGMLNWQIYICKECKEQFSNPEDCEAHSTYAKHYSFSIPSSGATLGFV